MSLSLHLFTMRLCIYLLAMQLHRVYYKLFVATFITPLSQVRSLSSPFPCCSFHPSPILPASITLWKIEVYQSGKFSSYLGNLLQRSKWLAAPFLMLIQWVWIMRCVLLLESMIRTLQRVSKIRVFNLKIHFKAKHCVCVCVHFLYSDITGLHALNVFKITFNFCSSLCLILTLVIINKTFWLSEIRMNLYPIMLLNIYVHLYYDSIHLTKKCDASPTTYI